MTDWKAKLKALHPCPEAYRWAIKHKTLREAWRMCEKRSWMTWLIEQCEGVDVMSAVYDVLYGFDSAIPYDEGSLQDTYTILDFMPDPPRLPEIT
jgi:hypothetical protein